MKSFPLGLLTGLYGSLTGAERRFFTALPFLVEQPRARVLSIGNLTVGGTGKTPLLLELLADPLARARTAILSRGYRSPWERGFYLVRGPGPHPAQLTDEALLVNRAFPDVPLLLGKNRAHAARCAERWFAPDVLVLDDGFQYRRLRHDVDLVLWDVTTAPWECQLLPIGRLREPLSRLREATVILLTRCEAVTDGERAAAENWLQGLAPGVPILAVQTTAVGWTDPAGRAVPLEEGPRKGFAFAAIARPEAFLRQLANVGMAITESRFFRDHQPFEPGALQDLGARARAGDAVPVCTEKDRVKISPDLAQAMGLFSLQIRFRTMSGESPGRALLEGGCLSGILPGAGR